MSNKVDPIALDDEALDRLSGGTSDARGKDGLASDAEAQPVRQSSPKIVSVCINGNSP
jgi:hypothetical protein